jgi:2-dehydro-3-deoxygluconokinase
VIYFSGITLAILSHNDADTLLSEARRAKASGKLVAFDPNIRPRLWSGYDEMHATISEGARAASLVLPSFEDEALHFGDASIDATIQRYRALGVRDIVVKNGADGITLNFDGTETFVPSEKVDTVVDTTSAGDSFNGAFLAHYLETPDAPAAARFAAKVAARVVSEHGALVAKGKLGV